MTDPQDLPEPEGWDLLFPFVVCRSQGGPYEDEAFVSGYQAGRIDTALRAAAAVGADSLSAYAYTPLVPQLELIGMHHGFTTIEASEVDQTGEHPAMPEWSHVRFSRGTDG